MQVEIFPRSVLVEREGLAARAQEVLGQNESPADATGSRAAGIPNSGYTSTTTCAPPSRWSRARWPASPRWWPGA
jgi:hypothetical protein